jgi:hypothetical protein
MLLEVVRPEKIRKPLDLFVCVPLEGVRLSAGACVKRQTLARTTGGEPRCRACELGAKVARRLGAELPDQTGK